MKRMRDTHHSQKDACGTCHLVESSKGPSQAGGGHFQDVEGVEAHRQATEHTKNQSAQDEDLKGFGDFGGRHQTCSQNREPVRYEDGVPAGQVRRAGMGRIYKGEVLKMIA